MVGKESCRRVLGLDGQRDGADVADVCREKRRFYFWGGAGKLPVREVHKQGERLSHVYLPLYPYIFKGISLTVSVGGSKRLIFSSVATEVFCNSKAKNSGPCVHVCIVTVFLTLPVVKEELLSLQNGSFGKDSNAVVSVHHYHCDHMH